LDWFIRDLGMPRKPARDQDRSGGIFERDRGAGHGDAVDSPRNPRKIDGPAQVREILLLAA